ncbi:MAG: hypothetical protein K2G91_00670, partial [Prevotella sp.]|nr:hypothetical protein [Prevotella sp.]
GRAEGQVEVEADRNMVGIVGDIEPDKIQGITKISSLKMSIRPTFNKISREQIILPPACTPTENRTRN